MTLAGTLQSTDNGWSQPLSEDTIELQVDDLQGCRTIDFLFVG